MATTTFPFQLATQNAQPLDAVDVSEAKGLLLFLPIGKQKHEDRKRAEPQHWIGRKRAERDRPDDEKHKWVE